MALPTDLHSFSLRVDAVGTVAEAEGLDDTAPLVLFVDDDDVLRGMVEELIAADPGMRLAHAADLDAGLERAEALRPDMVLLDLFFPGGRHGLELVPRLRARGLDMPIVVYSSHTDPDEVWASSRSDVRKFVPKGSDFDVLRQALRLAAADGGDAVMGLVRQLRARRDTLTCDEACRLLVAPLAGSASDVLVFRAVCDALKRVTRGAERPEVDHLIERLVCVSRERRSLPREVVGLLQWLRDAGVPELCRRKFDIERAVVSALRRTTGLSLHKSVTLELLRRATSKLLSTDEQVAQIAIQCGRGGGPQLWRNLGDLTGLLPRRLRACQEMTDSRGRRNSA